MKEKQADNMKPVRAITIFFISLFIYFGLFILISGLAFVFIHITGAKEKDILIILGPIIAVLFLIFASFIIIQTTTMKGIKIDIPVKFKNDFLNDLNTFLTNPGEKLARRVLLPSEVGDMIFIKMTKFTNFRFTLTRILIEEEIATIVGPKYVVNILQNHFKNKNYLEPKEQPNQESEQVDGEIPGLTKCVVCEGKISKNAETCPHCGEPNPARG